MTREEQRNMACTNWICSQENGTVIKARNVWKAAVEWADSHPHWIPVEERLPEHNEEENGLISYPNVLVCCYDGYRTEDYYDNIRGKWGDWDGEVEYWMPMPPPPVKKGGQDAR